MKITPRLRVNSGKFTQYIGIMKPVADPARAGGGAKNIFFRTYQRRVAPESKQNKQILVGSRALTWALEALAFLTVKYEFSHFSWYLFFKFFN